MTDSSNAATAQTYDDLDLVDILKGLWAERWLIAIVTLLVTGAATAYAFLATPQYEVRSLLRPPRVSQLSEINRSKLTELTPEESLRRVGAALESYDLRLAYFRANQEQFAKIIGETDDPERAFEQFNATSFTMLQPDEKRPLLSQYVGLTLTYPRGMDGKGVLNNFVRFAVQAEKEKMIAELNNTIEDRIVQLDWRIAAARAGYAASKDSQIAKLAERDNLKRAELQDELRALRPLLKKRREARIKLLEESIVIAKSLGITRPTTPSALGDGQGTSSGTVVRTEVNNQTIPLYFLGTDALEAERKALLERTTDDFVEPRVAEIEKELAMLSKNREIELLQSRQDEDRFLDGIDEMRTERAQLDAVQLTPENIELAQIDQLAVEPRSPVAPKKRVLMMAGAIVGVLLGVLIALLHRMFISDARRTMDAF